MSARQAAAEPARSRVVRTEVLISGVLRWGVLVCGAVLSVGVLSRLGHVGAPEASSRQLIGEMMRGDVVADYRAPCTWAAFEGGIREWQPDTLMASGLVLLIALPIVRVAMTVLLFFLEEDWAFFAITLVVLTVLLAGIACGSAL